MTYPSVEYDYALAAPEETHAESFGVRLAEVFAIFAIVFFVTGLIGLSGTQNSSLKDAVAYSRLLDVSIGAVVVDCVAFAVLLVAIYRRKR